MAWRQEEEARKADGPGRTGRQARWGIISSQSQNLITQSIQWRGGGDLIFHLNPLKLLHLFLCFFLLLLTIIAHAPHTHTHSLSLDLKAGCLFWVVGISLPCLLLSLSLLPRGSCGSNSMVSSFNRSIPGLFSPKT